MLSPALNSWATIIFFILAGLGIGIFFIILFLIIFFTAFLVVVFFTTFGLEGDLGFLIAAFLTTDFFLIVFLVNTFFFVIFLVF